MAAHKLHLNREDRSFLKSLRIEAWECPECNQKKLPLPKLNIEEKKPDEEK